MNKGFTLVELLCVIVIIAIISLITFPRVAGYINQTKESLYKTQVKDLEKMGEKWALDNLDKLDKYHINDTFITLDLLKDFKYLEKDEILNPKDKTEMNGCILIKYEKNKYTYKYIDEDCTDEFDGSEFSDSYVIYDSSENEHEELILEEVSTEYKHSPFYEDVLAKNNIKVVGETESGLYELDDEYVFRGESVNNYVKYQGKYWRILSIDKSDYSMKLINILIDQTALSTSETTDFTKATLQNTLAESVSNYNKISDEWNNGIINNLSSIPEIKSSISQNKITSKVGLLSLYDYAVASLDDNCYGNISNNCSNRNYLREMFKTNDSYLDIWTMSQNSENKFYYINSSNVISVANSTNELHRYATVIKVPINIYCTNSDEATGSDTTFAFNLK